MTRSSDPTFGEDAHEPRVILEWRALAMDLASRALCLMAAVATALSAFDTLAGRGGPTFPVFTISLGVLLLLYWQRKRLSRAQRFSGTLAAIFAMIASSIFSAGFNTPNQYLAMLVLVIVSELTLSHRLTLLFQLLSVGVVVMGGVWFVLFHPVMPEATSPYVAANWVRVAAIFTGLLAVTSVCLRHMVGRLRAALAEAAQLLVALSAETAARLKEEQEARLMQSRFEQAQGLESLGRLAGGVAHDFNNLLTIVMASAESLRHIERKTTKGDESEKHIDGKREALESIMAAVRNGSELTHELMALGGKYGTRRRLVPLDEVIGGTCGLVRRLVPPNIHFELQLHAANAWVRVCSGDLTQVVMNLVVNARDAMPNGGHLCVSTSNCDSRAQGEVLLKVSDTGIGMLEEVKRRVFEAYFTTKSEGQGTGLGLSIVDGVVKRLGGRVDIETEIGRGTSFLVRLPTADGPAQ